MGPDDRTGGTDQDGAGAAPAYAYPVDPRDGWEPGPPSVRALGPSAVGGAVVPLAVFYLVRGPIGGDASALAVAGIPAAAWVAVEWVRRRTIDPIGAITLFGFVAGVAASLALGGNAFVLKVRDSVFTAGLGLICLVSLGVGSRPVMFYVGRALSAREDRRRQRIYDELWSLPSARALFRAITVMWAVVLICEAGLRVVLAVILPTGPFLAASPVLAAVMLGGAVAVTIWMSGRARVRGQAIGDAGGADDASTWWWMGQYLRRGPDHPAQRDGTV